METKQIVAAGVCHCTRTMLRDVPGKAEMRTAKRERGAARIWLLGEQDGVDAGLGILHGS